MTRIGLLSDTHAFWDDRYTKYFDECDEVWHAGDIGSLELAERFERYKMFRAVYGNIDGQDIRLRYKKELVFEIEDVKVFMTHIGGYPGKYASNAIDTINSEKPKLFVCGHSHILRVKYDQKRDMLCVNPGAAGRYGMQQVRTLLRFTIDGGTIKDMEVIELGEK